MSTDDLAVKRQDSSYSQSAQNVSDVNRVGNVISNNAGGASHVEPLKDDSQSTIDDVKKQQQAANKKRIEKAISEVIKGTGLTVDEVMQMLESLNKDNKSVDFNTFQNVLNCLKFAILDSKDENGRLDKEKLKNVFGSYVLLCVKSRKKISCEQAHALMNMSLMDMIKAKNPALKNKTNITAQDIAATIKPLIDGQLDEVKMRKCPEQAKQLIRSMFATGLAKCTQEEMKILTEAFIILLKDKDLSEEVHMIVEVVCDSLKDKPELLNKFLNTTLTDLLKKYGFSDEAIERIRTSALGDFLSKNPDALKTLIQGGIDFLMKIKDSEDLQILLSVLNKHLNGQIDNLTEEEKTILNKYISEIDGLIQVYAQIAKNPEISKMFHDLINKLNGLVVDYGFDNYIFNRLKMLYENNRDLFANCQSEDDLAKVLNELTDNKYSKAVGDTNPDNLYKGNAASDNSDFGLPQRTSQENYWASLARQNDYYQSIYRENKSNEPEFVLLKNTEKPKNLFVTPWQRYNNVKNLSAQELYEGLKENRINIDAVLDNYKDLSNGAKLFVNKLIEIMSPEEQNYRLDGMPSSAVIDIIKHSKIDTEKLDLALDYASRKVLEDIEEKKAAV